MSQVDVRAAGGRKDATRIRNCYRLADDATVLAVMVCPNRLMSQKFRASSKEVRNSGKMAA
jgi:hypothetical protein